MAGKGSLRYKDARKLLDQLLGEDRNGDTALVSRQPYSDPMFCRFFLCGLCPYALFTNTKNDLGECQLKHVESKRAEYKAAKAAGREPGYEGELYELLRRIVDECQRRVRRAEQRLLETQGPEDVDPLSLEIKDRMGEVERLAEAGELEQSMAVLEIIERLKQQKTAYDKQRRAEEAPDGNPQTVQKLRVCEACGSFLSLYDNEKRLEDHYTGKLHQGFMLVRRRLEQLEAGRHGRGAGHAWANAPPPGPGGPPPMAAPGGWGGPPPPGPGFGGPPGWAGAPPPGPPMPPPPRSHARGRSPRRMRYD